MGGALNLEGNACMQRAFLKNLSNCLLQEGETSAASRSVMLADGRVKRSIPISDQDKENMSPPSKRGRHSRMAEDASSENVSADVESDLQTPTKGNLSAHVQPY